MTDAIWLALDIGTTGLKAALLDADGKVVRDFYKGYATQSAQGGVVEQDADNWSVAASAAIDVLSGQIEGRRLVGIAITGQMQDLIPLDRGHNLICPVILYSDTRAQQEAVSIKEQIGAERLRMLTGSDHDASSLLSKLLWLKHHEPAQFDTAATVLTGAADFIALFLTGQTASDTTTASTTSLLDLQTRQPLSNELFQAMGLPDAARLLPPVRPGGALIGQLADNLAELWGLPSGLPVHLGPGDAGAVTLGVGAGEPGRVYAYLGTSGWIAFTSETRATAEGVITLAHPHPERFIQVAPLLTAGGNLAWVRDLFDGGDYEQVIAQALAREPGPLLYLPYLNGERSPFRDAAARGAFVGLDARAQRADLYRAVLEGVVYAYRHALEALVDFEVDSLTLAGGGAKSIAWARLFADILNIPVEIEADVEYAGVRGAVMAALVARGELERYQFRNPTPPQTRLEPRDDYQAHYDRQYRLFRGLYPALCETFAGMAGTSSHGPFSTAKNVP